MSRVVAQADETGRLLERALVEIEHHQFEGKITEKKIQALEAQVKAADDLLDIYKATAEQYKTAALARQAANALDDQRVASYEARIKSYEGSLAAYETEVKSLRVERDKLKAQRKYIAGVALVLGLALGYLAATH